jgi:hypothetical protein
MRFSSLIQFFAVALLSSAYCASASAQNSSAIAKEPKLAESSPVKNPTKRESLLGVDTDGDGIRDDIEAIVARDRSATSAVVSIAGKADSDAAKKAETLRSLGEERPVRKEPPRRNCLDYLMLEPNERYKADLRLRAEANGVLGMHPCDPVMSPLLERPFESDFLQLDLGPVFLRY